MGEEQKAGDEGFVENATSETQEEVVSTPPAGDETPTEAVEEQGAEGLAGDETVDEIKAHLVSKYKDKGFNDNDLEQALRWHKGNMEAKTLKGEVTRLTEEAESSKGASEGLLAIARQIDGGPEALKEKGAAGFVDWVFGDKPQEAEAPAALDPSDPVQAQVLAMQAELKELRDERSKTDLDKQMEQAAYDLSSGADALKLKDDDKGTAKGVVTKLAEFHLATGGAVNPQLPTKDEIAASLKVAQKSLSSYNAIISGETEKKIEDGTPNTPEVVTETETKPDSSQQPDDWDDAEDAGFMSRAARD
jgi:hypothetical protein